MQSRSYVLRYLRDRLNKPQIVIEKDIWLTCVLSHLFTLPDSAYMSFGGGTSLSKVFTMIDRFSEDIDVIYDIRKLLPTVVAEGGTLPANRSGADKRTKAARHALNAKIADRFIPFLKERMSSHGAVDITASKREGSEKQPDDIVVSYPSVVPAGTSDNAYIESSIRIEFRGTSVCDPCSSHLISSIGQGLVPDVSFASATARVTDPRKTLLDKMMFIHRECLTEDDPKSSGKERLSRHWFDVSRMSDLALSAGFADFAQSWLGDMLSYQYMFFPKFRTTKDGRKEEVNLRGVAEGGIRLTPSPASALHAHLRDDYGKMLENGMIYGFNPPGFDSILDGCAAVAEAFNSLNLDVPLDETLFPPQTAPNGTTDDDPADRHPPK